MYRLSGFPKEATELLVDINPKYNITECWNDDLMISAVEDLIRNNSKILHRYFIFVRSLYHKFGIINHYFPKINKFRLNGGKDSLGVATSPNEMLAIAHYLYVLKSYGLTGYFLEFGCYKGFSSCCLSHACYYLDYKMKIFDSFKGLPDVGHSFYECGDYRGDLQEVNDNILTYGEKSIVEFVEGYYDQTLKNFSDNPVCLWMDVDLKESAQDISTIINKLPKNVAIFTHEFPQQDIGKLKTIDPSKSEVLPPIIDAMENIGMKPITRYLLEFTGSIWDINIGIPTIPFECILKIVNS